jgi:hypothetical protein
LSYLPVGTRVKFVGDAGYDTRTTGVIRRVDHEDPGLPYLIQWGEGWDEWHAADDVVSLDGPSLEIPAPGMTSADLAGYTARFVQAVTGRIRVSGHEQYTTPDGQRFESMTPDALLQYAREEAQDLAAYGAMLDIRLARVQAELNRRGLGETA